MASIYDDILSYIGGLQAQEVDLRASMQSNPNEVNPGPGPGGTNLAWGNVPGLEQFYSYDQANNAENFNLQAALPEIERLGYRVMQGFGEGGSSATWAVGPDGQPIAQSVRTANMNDDRFKLAALAAMGVTGANVLAAGFTAAGAPVAASGGGSVAPAVGGAQTFPVAPQAADVTTQLGALGGTTAPATTAGGVNLGVGGGATAADFGMIPAASGGATYGPIGAAEAAGTAVSSAGGFNWGDLLSSKGLRSGVDILSGLYGMKLAKDAREQSDPFAQYRPGYGQQLAQLEANPNLITQRPGWLAGTELITRQMASRGYTGSGNEKAAMQRYAGDFYNQEANRLAGLAGANQTPGAGQFTSAQLASQSLGSIGYGIAPWLPNKP